MSAIETWLREPAAQAVGWALVQFVWQGAVVGLVTAVALLVLRRSASDVRYVVSSIGLALMLTLPIVTGAQKYQILGAREGGAITHGPSLDVPSGSWISGISGSSGSSGMSGISGISGLKPGAAYLSGEKHRATARTPVAVAMAASFGALRAIRLDAWLPALMLIWIVGVSLLTLRLLAGWLWVQRLRTRGVAAADATWRSMATRLSRRLHIARAVTLLESTLVEVPTVIGFLKPVVLLPASALAALSPQQVEAILAHELAHIRRHDYLVNLLQTLVETVLFYHPAVWWLSRQIRVERENCCDDLAVSLCGDPVAYATALADLETLRSSGPLPGPHIALAATGGSLLDRVRRLLGAPSAHAGRGPAWLAGSVALLLVGGIALGASDAARDQAAPALAATPPMVTTIVTGAATIQSGDTTVRVKNATIQSSSASPALTINADSFEIAAPPPVPPTPPAPAAPAARVQESVSISHSVNNGNGNWIWSSNGDRLEVSYQGTFEFTDDDTDVRQMSAGGSLKISDGKWLGRHSVEVRERNGSLEHHYYVNTSERPYEPEGRAWLRDNLPKFVRNTGIGAEARVARLLKNGGAAAVLTEISRVDTAYVKGIYFKQLFKQGQLTGEQYRQAMAQASREMRSSDYELAQLLIAAADTLPNDESSRAAYFAAAGAIHSDYELRRVYSTMLKRGPVSSEVLAGILANAKSISSDYELAELLRQILSQQPLDDRNRAAFFNAAATIDAGYERHRVLSSVISSQRSSDPALLAAALAAAGSLRSDYETSQFLQEVLRQNGVEGSARAPFFAAVNTIGAAYERGRVLQAVVRKTETSPETLRLVLQSSQRMGGYELSQLLQLIANTHVIGADLRDAYLAAADRLGDYEQGQVMSALVKSERRR